MRVIVSGSRTWTHRGMIYAVLDGLRLEYEDFTLVHGHAKNGADKMANDWAKARGVEPERHPADWDKHGKAAGAIRNREMLKSGADLVVAFRAEGKSNGTDDMVTIATKADVPTYVVRRSG